MSFIKQNTIYSLFSAMNHSPYIFDYKYIQSLSFCQIFSLKNYLFFLNSVFFLENINKDALFI